MRFIRKAIVAGLLIAPSMPSYSATVGQARCTTQSAGSQHPACVWYANGYARITRDCVCPADRKP